MMEKFLALFLLLMLALPTGAFASSAFTIDFAFEKGKRDVEHLNVILDSLKLTDLEWVESKSYLAITTDAQGCVVNRRLGLTTGSIVCTLADGEEGYTYQIMTDVVDPDVSHEQYLNEWRENRPALVVRIAIRLNYENCVGYVITYHERV